MKNDLFTEKDCRRTIYHNSVANAGCVAILSPELFLEENRTKDNQLFRIQNLVFGNFCNDGRTGHINPHFIIGIADEKTEAYANELELKQFFKQDDYEEETLKAAADAYLIIRNSERVEFFAKGGHGYTTNPLEAGVFTITELKNFEATIITYNTFLSRKEIKRAYLAISVPELANALMMENAYE